MMALKASTSPQQSPRGTTTTATTATGTARKANALAASGANGAAPSGTWTIPMDPSVVVVDDIKALKQAVHDEMESMGCGRFQYRTVAILGLGNVADAVEILAIGYILSVYEDAEGKISPWESSLLTAAVFAGMLVGGLVGGVAGDIFGRKPVLLATLGLNAASAFLSALAPSIAMLIVCRTLAGIGVGGVVSSLFALCLEHVPVSARGRYVTILCSFWMVGSVATAATAWVMLGNDGDGHRIVDISWRWFAAVVGLPSVACGVLTLAFVPESAHFLASRGRADDVTDVLAYVHSVQHSARRVQFALAPSAADGDSTDNDGTRDDIAARKRQHESVQIGSFQNGPFPLSSRSRSITQALFDPERVRGVARLFDPSQRTTTVLLMLCGFCLSFGSYGLSTWIAKLFAAVGLANPFANAFLFAGANLPGNIVSVYLIDVVGRRELLSSAFFAAASCTLLFAFNVEGSATLVVAASCLFNACTTAAWNAFGVLSAENFPLEVRTTGISIVNCSGRIGAICAQFVNGLLVGPPPHIEALLLVVTSVMVAGGAASQCVPAPSADGGSSSSSHKRVTDDEDDGQTVMSASIGSDERSCRVGEEPVDSREVDTESALDDDDDVDGSHDKARFGGTRDEMRRCLRKSERSSPS